MKQLQPIIAFLCIFLLFGCIKDLKDVQTDDFSPEIAFPILNTSFTIQELLDEFETGGSIHTDAENFLTLIYDARITSLNASDIIEVEDIFIPMVDTALVFDYDDLSFNFLIQRTDLKFGQFEYVLTAPYQEDIDVTIEIENLKKDGSIFSWNFEVLYQSGASTFDTDATSLEGYELDFTQDLEVRYIAVNGNGERVYLQDVEFTIEDLSYSYIEGNFSGVNFPLPMDSITIDLFDFTINGDVFFEDPKVNLLFHNSFGIPFKVHSNLLDFQTQNSGTLSLQSTLDTGYDFAYPTLNEVGNTAQSFLSLDKDNSNIRDVVSALPFKCIYELSAEAFPDADTTTIGFALDTSNFEIDLNVAIPMWGRAGNLVAETDFDFNGEDVEDADEAEFKLYAANGFPVDIAVQLYFEDANGIVLDSLLNPFNNIIESALIGSGGRVSQETITETLVPVSGETLQRIRNANNMRMKTFISTIHDGITSVKFYSDYKMDLDLGVKAIVN